MSIHYVEYKDFSDLSSKFELSFGSQNVLVFVWKSVAGLKRNTIFKGDYVGAYIPYPYRKKSGLFGEIHLVARRMDAEYVAHEIQHFIYDWSSTQKKTASFEERQATLAGQITGDFWKAYKSETVKGIFAND